MLANSQSDFNRRNKTPLLERSFGSSRDGSADKRNAGQPNSMMLIKDGAYNNVGDDGGEHPTYHKTFNHASTSRKSSRADRETDLYEMRNTGNISVRDYVKASFNDKRSLQTELNYQPDTYLDKKVINWKQESKKSTFLDPIIKQEKKKQLGPGSYSNSKHSNWADDISNCRSHGHAKKGVFQPRERPLVTTEFMAEVKRRAIPAPGAYNNMPPKDKLLLGHSNKSAKSSYHID